MTARRTRHADSESAIYQDRDVVGHILVRAGKITATDASGRKLGVYPTDRAAMSAIIAKARGRAA
jgi:hypothetical protein